MLSKRVFNYVNKLLQEICDSSQPFGGKTVVLGGDWKQLPPVVEHGTPEDQINESIKIQPLFTDRFQRIRYVF